MNSLLNILMSFFNNSIESEKRKEFIDLFYEYRFLGGECEFNAEEILEMALFEEHKSKSLSEFFKEQAKKQLENFVKTAAITTVAGAAEGVLFLY